MASLPSCAEDPPPPKPSPKRARAVEAIPVGKSVTGDSAVAEIVAAENDVRVRRAPDIAWKPAGKGLRLQPEDAVQTMEDSSASIRFDTTGGLAELGPLATLRVPRQAQELTRLKHISGKLSAVLQPGERRARVEVELPPGTLVLERPEGSTEARVEAQLDVTPERTSIAMVSGKGTLRSEAREAVRIETEHFVEIGNHDGAVVDTGRSGPPVRPRAPADEAHVRTRGSVRFAWEPNAVAEGYRVAVFQQSEVVRSVNVGRTASHAALELGAGPYTWTVRGLKGGEPMPSHPPRKLRVSVDKVPPSLSLDAPHAGQVVKGGRVRVRGRAEPGSRVEVDGRPIDVGRNGSFSVSHPVKRGVSNIVVRAIDQVGNVKAIPRPVLRN